MHIYTLCRAFVSQSPRTGFSLRCVLFRRLARCNMRMYQYSHVLTIYRSTPRISKALNNVCSCTIIVPFIIN